jgi:hypothetical protein
MLTQFWHRVALLCLLVYAQSHLPENTVMTEQHSKQERKSGRNFPARAGLIF